MKHYIHRSIDRLPRLLDYLSSKKNGFTHSLHQRLLSSSIRPSAMNHEFIDISDEVQCALLEKRPIVALESAIITHGMPNPTNVETALSVQNIVRQNGAVPATIAIVRGKVKVGLDDKTLLHLGTEKKNTYKTSYRDLPFVLSQKLNGGTTVSTTLAVAKAIGVSVMVTGGIGGVHRGGETTMDISADLIELGCTPVGVVCSGAKSILDIGRTLEYLETQGVLVTTFGPNRDFPAFYSRRSGYTSPYNVETTEEAAQLINVMKCGEFRSGIVIAVPVPESNAIPSDEMEDIIKIAVQEANERGVKGKDITPYILSKVAKNTEGRSLSTNVALIQNNAEIGAKIAVDLSKLSSKRLTSISTPKKNGPIEKKPDVVS
ncbi:Pseudouridine-5'-phosphate glycosidase [Frankliniella fusca]|uniref:Pseudouridine-5'-phosphate glycosidase n=1 Tax=Frankliniella fusca TaxID=407009 RepID=A0AAE1GV37_9NEOP|nr:Pseudouridine-5'-phosphate glycosidase [Frankliniella fusca]